MAASCLRVDGKSLLFCDRDTRSKAGTRYGLVPIHLSRPQETETLELSAGSVRVAVHRLQHPYRDLLREELAVRRLNREQVDEGRCGISLQPSVKLFRLGISWDLLFTNEIKHDPRHQPRPSETDIAAVRLTTSDQRLVQQRSIAGIGSHSERVAEAGPRRRWIQRNPLLAFFTLAFLFTWGNWVPRALASHGLLEVRVPDFMFFVAGYGPALAAVIIAGLTEGTPGLLKLGQRLCRWRVGFHWYAVALLLPGAQTLAALGLRLLSGGQLPVPAEAVALASSPAGSTLFIHALLLGLMFTLGFDGLGEELGWRGFALPRLLARCPALGASIGIGAIWALWHLPYALTKGSAMSGTPFHAHLSHMFAASILFTWIYNHTRGSVLLAILFHAAGNVTFHLLPILIPGVYSSGIWAEVVRWTVVAAVVAIDGPRHLARLNPDLRP